jgi:acyl-coenzyme A thioesterase PaaI-like protein
MPSPAAPRFVDRVEDMPAVSEIAALSGLEVMQGVLTGRLPTPPICRTVGFRLAEVDKGRVVFEGTPDFRHYNVLGGAHGGRFGTMLDSCMGCAVHTCLPRGKGYTTLEYKKNIIRRARPETGMLRPLARRPMSAGALRWPRAS